MRTPYIHSACLALVHLACIFLLLSLLARPPPVQSIREKLKFYLKAVATNWQKLIS